MVVAKSRQWAKLEARARAARQAVTDYGRVLAVRHEHGLLDLDVPDAEDRSRKGIEPELDLAAISFGVERAGILIGS